MSAEVKYTMFSNALDVPPKKRTYESYKLFMTGLRGDDAKRMRKYIGQIAREMVPLEKETLSAFVSRVGTAVKARFDGPKSVSPHRMESPPRAASPPPAAKKTKRNHTPPAERMVESPIERPKVRAKKQSPTDFDQMMKMFETANLTKTTKRNVIASRPKVKTSRQQTMEAANAKRKEEEKAYKALVKKIEEERVKIAKERKEYKKDLNDLSDMFSFKLGGKGKKH